MLAADLEAELQHTVQANAVQATELATLQDAASASAASLQTVQQELVSKAEQLQLAQAQALQLSAESDKLQLACDEQAARCSQLEADLASGDAAASRLQERLQAEAEALHAVQEELQCKPCRILCILSPALYTLHCIQQLPACYVYMCVCVCVCARVYACEIYDSVSQCQACALYAMYILSMQGVCYQHHNHRKNASCLPHTPETLPLLMSPEILVCTISKQVTVLLLSATCDMPTTLGALGAAGRTEELADAQEQAASRSSEVHSLQANAAELTQAKHNLLQQLEQQQQELALKAGQHVELQTAHEQVAARCTELEKQVEHQKQRTAGVWQDSLVCVIYVRHGMQIHALLGCHQV